MSHEDVGRGLTRRNVLARGGQLGVVLGGGALLAACGGGGGDATSEADTVTGEPRKGGTLRVGLADATGGKLNDPQNFVGGLDLPMTAMLYNAPAVQVKNGTGRLALADEIASNDTATEWTIRLKRGVEFHNGKELTADDLLFTVRRALSKTQPTTVGSAVWAWVNPNKMRKLDRQTVRFTLDTPYSIVFEQMYNGGQILPVGFDPAHPIGTGPFKLIKANPGRGATLERFANYWDGAPYLDRVELIQFTDPDALFNALLGGQLDAVDSVNGQQLGTLKANDRFVVQTATTIGGNTRMIEMIMTMKPFDDPRVRQAMRLLADREQMIAQVFPGQALIGNDVWASGESPDYDRTLAQRHQDAEQAKFLLKQAGVADDQFELAAVQGLVPGMGAAAQAYAAQATDAGVSVKVSMKDPSTYYTSMWKKYPFFVGAAGGSTPYLINAFTYERGPGNETNWNDREWSALLDDALATPDRAKRLEIEHAMQRIEWERGTSIIWSWNNSLSAYSKRFAGYVRETKLGWPLEGYDFHRVFQVQ